MAKIKLNINYSMVQMTNICRMKGILVWLWKVMSFNNKTQMILFIKNIFMIKIKLMKNNLILLWVHNMIWIILIKKRQDYLKSIVSLKIKFFTKVKTKTTLVTKLRSFLHNLILKMNKKFKKIGIHKTLLMKRIKVLELQLNSRQLNKNRMIKVRIVMLLSKISQRKIV